MLHDDIDNLIDLRNAVAAEMLSFALTNDGAQAARNHQFEKPVDKFKRLKASCAFFIDGGIEFDEKFLDDFAKIEQLFQRINQSASDQFKLKFLNELDQAIADNSMSEDAKENLLIDGLVLLDEMADLKKDSEDFSVLFQRFFQNNVDFIARLNERAQKRFSAIVNDNGGLSEYLKRVVKDFRGLQNNFSTKKIELANEIREENIYFLEIVRNFQMLAGKKKDSIVHDLIEKLGLSDILMLEEKFLNVVKCAQESERFLNSDSNPFIDAVNKINFFDGVDKIHQFADLLMAKAAVTDSIVQYEESFEELYNLNEDVYFGRRNFSQDFSRLEMASKFVERIDEVERKFQKFNPVKKSDEQGRGPLSAVEQKFVEEKEAILNFITTCPLNNSMAERLSKMVGDFEEKVDKIELTTARSRLRPIPSGSPKAVDGFVAGAGPVVGRF